MFDIVQSGANKANCKYGLEAGFKVSCAIALIVGLTTSLAALIIDCPPNASLANAAASLASSFIGVCGLSLINLLS